MKKEGKREADLFEIYSKKFFKKKKNLGGKVDLKKLIAHKNISVGNAILDEQHKRILDQIEKLGSKISDDKLLVVVRECIPFLSRYINEHFSAEEAYMKKWEFTGLSAHIKIHENFLEFYEKLRLEFPIKLKNADDVHAFAREYVQKMHNFLVLWFIGHVMDVDKKYAVFIEKKKKKMPKAEAGIAKSIKEKIIQDLRKPTVFLEKKKLKENKGGVKDYIYTGVSGFDELLEKGIPQGTSLIVAGGAGSGKTIFCLQTLINKAREGKKCLYMTLEEEESKLIAHMEDFGWNPRELIKKGLFKIMRVNPFEITRNVDALLAQQKGELLIEIEPVIIPAGFKPDFIVIDSLTAIASAFTGKDDSYRIYIEQLFRFLQKLKSTSFLITETEQVPKIFSQSGVEEFLADGVIVLYAIKHGNVRENALEILKLRGAAHQKKIVAMQITENGIVVYPEQEVFGGLE